MAEGGVSGNDFFLKFGSDAKDFSGSLEGQLSGGVEQINKLKQALLDYEEVAKSAKENSSVGFNFTGLDQAAARIEQATTTFTERFGSQMEQLTARITGLTEILSTAARGTGRTDAEPYTPRTAVPVERTVTPVAGPVPRVAEPVNIPAKQTVPRKPPLAPLPAKPGMPEEPDLSLPPSMAAYPPRLGPDATPKQQSTRKGQVTRFLKANPDAAPIVSMYEAAAAEAEAKKAAWASELQTWESQVKEINASNDKLMSTWGEQAAAAKAHNENIARLTAEAKSASSKQAPQATTPQRDPNAPLLPGQRPLLPLPPKPKPPVDPELPESLIGLPSTGGDLRIPSVRASYEERLDKWMGKREGTHPTIFADYDKYQSDMRDFEPKMADYARDNTSYPGRVRAVQEKNAEIQAENDRIAREHAAAQRAAAPEGPAARPGIVDALLPAARQAAATQVTEQDLSAARVSQKAVAQQAQAVAEIGKLDGQLATSIKGVVDELEKLRQGIEANTPGDPDRSADGESTDGLTDAETGVIEVEVANTEANPVPVAVVGGEEAAGGGRPGKGHGAEPPKRATTATAAEEAKEHVEGVAAAPVETVAEPAKASEIVTPAHEPRSNATAAVEETDAVTAVRESALGLAEQMRSAAATIRPTGGSISEPTAAGHLAALEAKYNDAVGRAAGRHGEDLSTFNPEDDDEVLAARRSLDRARTRLSRFDEAPAAAATTAPLRTSEQIEPELAQARRELSNTRRNRSRITDESGAERLAEIPARDAAVQEALARRNALTAELEAARSRRFVVGPTGQAELPGAATPPRLFSVAPSGAATIFGEGHNPESRARTFSVGSSGDAFVHGESSTPTPLIGRPAGAPVSLVRERERQRVQPEETGPAGPFRNFGQSQYDLGRNPGRQEEYGKLAPETQQAIATARERLAAIVSEEMSADARREAEQIVAEAAGVFKGDPKSGLLRTNAGQRIPSFVDSSGARRAFGDMVGLDTRGNTGAGAFLQREVFPSGGTADATRHFEEGTAPTGTGGGIAGSARERRAANAAENMSAEEQERAAALDNRVTQILLQNSGRVATAKAAEAIAQAKVDQLETEGVGSAEALARAKIQLAEASLRVRAAQEAETRGTAQTAYQRFTGKTGGSFTGDLKRHGANALENTIGYTVVFTGYEKLKELVKDGIDSQAAFVRLQATLDANGVSASNLKTKILNISSQTAQPIEAVAEAASHLAGAFRDTAEIETGTRVASQLANISQGTLTAVEAARGLVDVTTAYGLSGPKAIQAVGDQIALLSLKTGVSVKDITEGTTQIAQEAHEFGLSQQKASVLAAYVSRGTGETGEQSASQLSRMLGGLYNGQTQTTLIKAGVATDAQFRQGDIAGVFTSLISKYHELQPAQQQSIASLLGQGVQARAFAAAMNLGADGVAALNGNLNTNNELNKLNSQYLFTVKGSIKELTEDFENMGAELQQLGAFDFIEGAAKSVDLLFKVVDNLVGKLNALTGGDTFGAWLKHIAVFAGEAALALKVVGGSVGTALGKRGLVAPTAESVAARQTAYEAGAVIPALAYPRANLRSLAPGTLARNRAASTAALRAGLTEEQYAVIAGSTVPRAGFFSRTGSGLRNMLIGNPNRDTAAARQARLDGVLNGEQSGKVTEKMRAETAAIAAQNEHTLAVDTSRDALLQLAEAAKLAAGSEGEAAIARTEAQATANAARASAESGGAAAATGAAESGAAGGATGAAEGAGAGAIAGRRPGAHRAPVGGGHRPENVAGRMRAAGATEEEIAAAGLPAEEGAAARAGIGGLAGSVLPLAGIAAGGYMAYEGLWNVKNVNTAINQGYDANLAHLTDMHADAPGSDQTQYKKAPSLSRGDFIAKFIGGDATNPWQAIENNNPFEHPLNVGKKMVDFATNVVTWGHGTSYTLPQAGPSDKSGNDSLAFDIKQINAAGRVKNAKGATVEDIQNEEGKINDAYLANAQRIAKEGGNDKASQTEILREMEIAHQGILDSNARTEAILAAKQGIDAALAPTQVAGLSSFASGTQGISVEEATKNPGAIIDALNGSNVPVGTPAYNNAMEAVGVREKVTRSTGVSAITTRLAAQGDKYVSAGQNSISALGLKYALDSVGGQDQASAALSAAMESGDATKLQAWAKTYGYTLSGLPKATRPALGGLVGTDNETPGSHDLSGVRVSGGNGSYTVKGQYEADPKADYNTRLGAQIKTQQTLIDSTSATLNQSKLITYLDPKTGKMVTREVSASEASSAAPDSDLAKKYAASKATTYAPGTSQYNDALSTSLGAQQAQSQLMAQQQQSKFQFAQGQAGLAANLGNDDAALAALHRADSGMEAYIKANNLSAGDPEFIQLMTQIQANKQEIADLQASPAINRLTEDSAATNDQLRKANDAYQIAVDNYNKAKAAGKTGEALSPYTTAINSANVGQAQASQAIDIAQRQVGIVSIRNSVGNARATLGETQYEEGLASGSTTADRATYARLQGQEVQNRQTLHDAIEAQSESRHDSAAALDSLHGDAVGAATQTLQKANQAYTYAVAQYGATSQQARQALAGVYQSEQTRIAAQLAQQNSALDLQIAQLNARGKAGDSTKAAQDGVQKAKNALNSYLHHGGKKGTTEYNTLMGTLATAQRTAFDTALQAQLDTLDFQQQTYQITSAQEVRSLQQILKNKQLTLQEQRDITLKIKSLQDSIRTQLTQGGLNIPSNITLPTAYDVRRSLGSGFSGSATHTNTVNNNQTVTVNNNVPNSTVAAQIANSVITLINQQTGAGLRANSSTPRQVATK